MKRRDSAGFTMVELLVVVAIIGILAATSMANFEQYRSKAKIAAAKSEMKSIATAITLLEQDTGLSVRGLALSPCVQDPETYVNSANAGLVSNPGTFTNWKGPYITTDLTTDPWGNAYYFDPDYNCSIQKSCNGTTGWVRALVSRGEDTGVGWYSSEKIVQILCVN